MSETPVTLSVPDALLELVAQRVAELVAERNGNGAGADPWLNVDQAAEYIAAPKNRIYDLRRGGRVRFGNDGARLLVKRSELDRYLEGDNP